MILKELKINVGKGKHITNCYIIMDEKTKETMVVDPAGEADKISEMIDILGGNLKYILLTHCHGDHFAAINDLKAKKGGKLLIHRTDANSINDSNITLVEYIGLPKIEVEVDSRVDDGDLIHIGDIEFKIIHTPGHTKGSICAYSSKEKLLLSGDTLFFGTWGRADLPTSNFSEIITSIENKLLVLPEDTIVYPGHGKITRISDEEHIYYNMK